MPISKYDVKIEYHASASDEITIYADSPKMAEEIALVAWKDTHTPNCKDPKVISVRERGPK